MNQPLWFQLFRKEPIVEDNGYTAMFNYWVHHGDLPWYMTVRARLWMWWDGLRQTK